MVNRLDRMGKDLLNLDSGSTRGHGKKLKERCERDIKKYSFPHRVIDTQNGLEEDVVNDINVHKFKAQLEKLKSRDRP